NAVGVAAIAARSERLTTAARRPSSPGVSQVDRKCPPSTRASVVRGMGEALGARTAQSSPGSTRTRTFRPALRAPRWRSLRQKSPRKACSRSSPRGWLELSKPLADLVEEALRGMHVLSRLVGELLKELPLAGVQMTRRLDDHPGGLISRALAVEVGDPLAAEPEEAPRLGPLLDLHLDGAVDRGDVELGAEGRLG